MANELKMAIVESILQLRSLHWSARRIARQLGIDRGAVGRHLKRAEAGAKAAISPAGSAGPKAATLPPIPGTREAQAGPADSAGEKPDSKPAISPTGSRGENGCLADTV